MNFNHRDINGFGHQDDDIAVTFGMESDMCVEVDEEALDVDDLPPVTEPSQGHAVNCPEAHSRSRMCDISPNPSLLSLTDRAFIQGRPQLEHPRPTLGEARPRGADTITRCIRLCRLRTRLGGLVHGARFAVRSGHCIPRGGGEGRAGGGIAHVAEVVEYQHEARALVAVIFVAFRNGQLWASTTIE